MTNANSTTQQSTTDLSLNITTEYKQVNFNEQELYTMFTITAPEYEPEDKGARAPIDLVCVIDKSGSMAGEKMDLMKKTLLFMVEQLKPMDKLSLVLFDTYVTTALPLTAMDEIGKKQAVDTVKNIHDGSSTNLSGGLIEGLQVIKNRIAPSEVTSLLLFTDGLANAGLTKSEQIVPAVQKILQEIGKAVSVFTFGFGSDHDGNMLRAISEAGTGLYYYLEKVDNIPETFSDCLGGLLSVMGQNIKLRIETLNNGVEISKIHSSYRKNEVDAKNNVELLIGDVYSEESKNIILTLKVPQLRSALESQELVRVTLSYFNVIQTELREVIGTAIISRVEQPNEAPNTVLDKQRNRVECANALEEARNLANNQQLEPARGVLQQTMQRIQSSTTQEDDFCKGLVNDLQDCLNGMQDRRNYEQVASKKLNNYWMSSNYERSTNTNSSAQASYVTKTKAASKKSAIEKMKNHS
jgi:Mg-chelatase subunit ChlD